ncbi:MAG: hypothetical protein IKI69_05920 [Oscillospiraceae bacterium]|nr:hypothetical protein [Oscillospiraceae bacterium]
MRWKNAALTALIAALLLGGCTPVLAPQESALSPAAGTQAPVATDPPAPTGVWKGDAPAAAALAVTLAPELSSPPPLAPAAVSLDIDAAGHCLLRCDYSPCAEPLRDALTEFLRALWAEEGESYPGAKPDEIAAVLLEERLPPPLLLHGTLAPDGREIRWERGEVSPLTCSENELTLSLPGWGELSLLRSGE